MSKQQTRAFWSTPHKTQVNVNVSHALQPRPVSLLHVVAVRMRTTVTWLLPRWHAVSAPLHVPGALRRLGVPLLACSLCPSAACAPPMSAAARRPGCCWIRPQLTRRVGKGRLNPRLQSSGAAWTSCTGRPFPPSSCWPASQATSNSSSSRASVTTQPTCTCAARTPGARWSSARRRAGGATLRAVEGWGWGGVWGGGGLAVGQPLALLTRRPQGTQVAVRGVARPMPSHAGQAKQAPQLPCWR